MTRTTCFLLMLCAALGTPPARAAERLTVKLDAPGALQAWIDGADAAAARFDAACAALELIEGDYALWLTPSATGWSARGGDAANKPAASWQAAARDAAATAAAFGWRGAERNLLVRHGRGGWFIGQAGRDGAWFSEACAALGALVALVAGAEAAPGFSSGMQLRGFARMAGADLPILPANGRAVMSIAGVAGDTPPHLVGPPGLEVVAMRRAGAGWRADLALDRVPPGRQGVLVYEEGRHFGPSAEIELLVTAGGRGDTPADEAGAEIASAAPLVSGAAARLAPGDADLWRVELADGGALHLASSGATDLVARLETADGTVLAGDDDSGAGYNFRLDLARLPPGSYFLRVLHCCGGSGPYQSSKKV